MAAVEERLRDWIDGKTREFEAKGQDGLRGEEWWQVSLEEQAVFGLRPQTMARVLAVFEAYQALAYDVGNELGGAALCEEARKTFPWIGESDRGSQADLEAFQRFAKLFGVSSRQSYAFYWKQAFHAVRSGIVRFEDETDEEHEKALGEAALWPDDHPRLRGLYPETEPVGTVRPQVLATISLDADLYDWLKGFVSTAGGFTFCVEQTINTALRALRGGSGNLDVLAQIVAIGRETTPIEAVFGDIGDDSARQAAAHLYQAARLAARRPSGPGMFEDLLPAEHDREPVLALLGTLLPGWDPVKEVEAMWAARNAETEVSEEDEKALRRDQEKGKEGDFDESIPF